MIADYQIRQWLARYLHRVISLDQFEDWLVQRSWNMHLDSDESAQKLAAAIELRLAEHSSGHLDEDRLRHEMTPFLTTYTATVRVGHSESGLVVFTDAQNTSVTPRVFVIQGEMAGLFQAFSDTPHAAVSL
jgi:hypothetical protein